MCLYKLNTVHPQSRDKQDARSSSFVPMCVNQVLRPELTYSNLLMLLRLFCPTYSMSAVRDTADPIALTLLVLCSTVHQAYKDGLVLMQQKAIENIKHICSRNTPTGGQRQIQLCVRLCLSMFLCTSANVADVCV